MNGNVALVTGANRKLKQAMALGLADPGADVAGLDVLEMTDTRAQVEGLWRRYHSVAANIMEPTPDTLSEIVADIVDALGSVDILLNNAGNIRRAHSPRRDSVSSARIKISWLSTGINF